MWTSNPESTASFATCALSSDNQHGHYRISALHIFGYAHADYPGRLHYLVSKKDEPLPDKYHDTSALRRRLVSNFALGWMRNKVERKPGSERKWKVQSTCYGAWMSLRRYLSKYRTATFSWWSFLERANRAWGLLNWHWELMMASPWHRSRTAHSKACIFGGCK